MSMGNRKLVGGKYKLGYRIGKGAMGVVWSAINVQTGRQVALKLLASDTEASRQRLLREARACGQLSHRNIIEVLDVGETEEGEPFLVMPLLTGETLADLLERRRRLDFPMVAQIGRDIARALVPAHAAGIVHRDLKPSNTFLHREAGAEGVLVKVLDFGICKCLSDKGDITGPDNLLGTPYYMSLEQLSGTMGVDGRADIWSLGVMLFQMLTGERPFVGERMQDIIWSIIDSKTAVPLVSQMVLDVPQGMTDIVAQCLVRDRERRVQTAEELAARLQMFASPGDYVQVYGSSSPLSASSPASARRSIHVEPAGAPRARASRPRADDSLDELFEAEIAADSPIPKIAKAARPFPPAEVEVDGDEEGATRRWQSRVGAAELNDLPAALDERPSAALVGVARLNAGRALDAALTAPVLTARLERPSSVEPRAGSAPPEAPVAEAPQSRAQTDVSAKRATASRRAQRMVVASSSAGVLVCAAIFMAVPVSNPMAMKAPPTISAIASSSPPATSEIAEPPPPPPPLPPSSSAAPTAPPIKPPRPPPPVRAVIQQPKLPRCGVLVKPQGCVKHSPTDL